MRVCVVTVGNEILKGKTINTNAAHIGRLLTFAGHEIVLGITVPDRIEDIVWAFKNAMENCEIVISCGGLGPTYDDMTLEGLSKGLGLELELNKEAEEMIRKKYESMKVEITPARIKMARLPIGSRVVYNPVGTAPGVFLEYLGRKIVVLPGVPAEMKAILDGIIGEIKAKDHFYYEESVVIKGIMESAIAPVVDAIMKKNEGRVYIKSHPRKSEDKSPELEIEISGSSSSEGDAKRNVKKALNEIKIESERLRSSVSVERKEYFH